VARDRKRAKQRRERGRAAAVGRGSAAGAQSPAAPAAPPPVPDHDEPNGLERVDVPGSLDHASADVDEFDAALVRGAGGTPVDNDLAEQAFGSEDELQDPAGGPPSGGGAGGSGGDGGAGGPGAGAAPSGAPLRGGNRAIGFIRASWAELQRVQWPDRRQVTQATAVVIGFVAIAGAYLGLADVVAKEIVEFIL
jgi:preprotein translocase subunit SecE